ncbi:transcriptional regulator [Gandjariella thermophila]|uniref:Transcriptional regulator n=1 Tax=Gandjariella thermophila TaxID=1931992 RepID=A0A4D4J7Y1_9PSEU|nr:transcriptional regulator [Gandjariella thermophila]
MVEEFRAGVRVRRIARRARRWREAAQMKGVDAASRLHWSPAKLSKIEHGALPVAPVDVLALALIYDVPEDERNAFFRAAQTAQQRGWWQDFGRDEVLDVAQDYIELESEAELLRTFSIDLVPGLLQTHDYTAALSRRALPRASDEIDQRRAEARTARQERLSGDDPLRVEAIMTEAALRLVIGGPEVMRAQLETLLRFARLPNVRLQVLPFAVGAYPSIGSPFSVLSFAEEHFDDVVYVENLTHGVFVEDSASVQTYTMNFAGLQKMALSPTRSAKVIAEVAGAL